MIILSLSRTPKQSDNALDVDMIEWRLDLAPLDEKKAQQINKPWIATLRHKSEGGQFSGTAQEREKILGKALELGARWVDVEAQFPLGKLPTAQTIRSSHLKTGDTDERQKCLRELHQAPGALGKWVRPTSEATGLCPEENYLLKIPRPCVIIHAQQGGLWTRVAPPGLPWKYTCESHKSFTGPGQLSVEESRKLDSTPLFGIVGFPVAHSLSPKFHNRVRQHLSLKGSYLPLPVKDLNDFFEGLSSQFEGLSITTPHKENVLNFVSHRDPITEQIQAANTLTQNDDGWSATNTDALGLKKLLAPYAPTKKNAAVIGCGGFGRAALWACQELGFQTTLINRDSRHGEQWAEKFNCHFSPLEGWKPKDEEILIQATSAEMKKERLPFTTRACSDDTLLIESIYSTGTKFSNEAPTACARLSGLDIFLAQAIEQAQLWTGENLSDLNLSGLL